MNEYEVIIDLGSKTFRIEAKSKEEAEAKAMKKFEALSDADKIEEYWIADATIEVEE